MIIIREIKSPEHSFLESMLYEAIYVPEGKEPLPKDIINKPDLKKYIKDFGKEDDYCLVAEYDGCLIGAIWIRLFSRENRGYGYVDENTPELSIALYREHRGAGIGTKLLCEMMKYMKNKGYTKVSLSVDENNNAFNLYKKLGFKTVSSEGKSHIMVKNLV